VLSKWHGADHNRGPSGSASCCYGGPNTTMMSLVPLGAMVRFEAFGSGAVLSWSRVRLRVAAGFRGVDNH